MCKVIDIRIDLCLKGSRTSCWTRSKDMHCRQSKVRKWQFKFITGTVAFLCKEVIFQTEYEDGDEDVTWSTNYILLYLKENATFKL
jgi:hypothetical protein